MPLTSYKLPVGYRDLLFQKDSNGVVLGTIQEIRPENNYLKTKGRTGSESMRQFVSNEDFSGDIIIFDPFNNAPLRGRRFKDGLLTGELKYRSQALMVGDPNDPVDPWKKPGGLDDDGSGFEITLPTVEVTAPAPSTSKTPGTNIPFPTEPVRPVPGGPVTPNNPIPIGGGRNSNSSSPSTIKSELKNSCLTAAYSSVYSNDLKNWISASVKAVFNKDANLNITFRERPATSFESGELGHFNRQDTHFGGDGNQYGDVYIDLNVDVLPKVPKELIVVVILHESLHGYFAQQGEKFQDASAPYITQHDKMAAAYRSKLSEALAEIFPNMSSTDRDNLSWEGLQQTIEWTGERLKNAISNNNKFKNITDYCRLSGW
ncbi:hypothetical protein [Chitinophaga polysaccharea]|uniref:hypothetical protein n=1 Tax=Chitinophaga polysaccharea TaxID=1293035 RepID=UPI001159491C|nr:hypothetical protein [Chitinophaga polysaccharea]